MIEKNQKTFFNFLEVGEVQGVAIFCSGRVGKVWLDSEWFEVGYATHR